jgi:hypothetical protein
MPMSHTIEFTCQDCGADIVTSEDLDGLPVCVICRDTRRLEVETESPGLADAGVPPG